MATPRAQAQPVRRAPQPTRALAPGPVLSLTLTCSVVFVALVPAPVLAVETSPAPHAQVGPQFALVAEELRKASPPKLRLAERPGVEAVATLPPAAEAAAPELKVVEAWNRAGMVPRRTGFTRALPRAHRVELGAVPPSATGLARTPGGFAAPSPRGDLLWGTVVEVAGAHRLRLHLSEVDVPAGTRFWVYGGDGRAVEFGRELVGAGGGLWTPSVSGERLYLEVEIPRSALAAGARPGFAFGEVLEIFRLDAEGAPRTGTAEPRDGHCLVDATCVGSGTLDVVESYRRAVAFLEYVDGGGAFICSGALLNDTDPNSDIPYLLTANHCFSNQAATDTLEAFWDYRSASCNGGAPGIGSLPRSQGGTLLASRFDTDFTFVRLHDVPAGRTFLGWSAQPTPAGTVLHRISHPNGQPQSYSRSVARDSGVEVCFDAPRPRYLYAAMEEGATQGGSSGAPVIRAGGFVVGQLSGGCPGLDGCDYANSELDGAFSDTFPHVQAWLQPAGTGGGGGGGGGVEECLADATTLCLDDQPGDGRWEVTMDFENLQASGSGKAIPLSSLGITRGGIFWIGNAANPEMLIKVLDGCAVNGRYWVFYAATTNQGLVTTVRDTKTDLTWTRTNPVGQPAAPVQDTSAFACG